MSGRAILDFVTSARRLHHTYAEYLEVEARSDVRHEYLGGEIYGPDRITLTLPSVSLSVDEIYAVLDGL